MNGNRSRADIDENLCRAELSTSQRALIAAGFLEYEREQAKVRMKEAGAIGGAGKGKEIFPDPSESGQARDKAGERMHVSRIRPVQCQFCGTTRGMQAPILQARRIK